MHKTPLKQDTSSAAPPAPGTSNYEIWDILGNTWTAENVERIEVDLRGLLTIRYPDKPDEHFGIGAWITYNEIDSE